MTFETDHSVPPADVAAALLEGARLAYASDYVSFSGADEHGRVAFAIDTNRAATAGPDQPQGRQPVVAAPRDGGRREPVENRTVTDWARRT